MEIFVSRNGEQFGPFDRPGALAALKAGTLRYDDLAWHSQDPSWKPLAEVLLIETTAPTWSEIAAALPAPRRTQARVPVTPAPLVQNSGGSSAWMVVLILILVGGGAFYLYTRKAPPPTTPSAVVASNTPTTALSEMFFEDDPATAKKPRPAPKPQPAAQNPNRSSTPRQQVVAAQPSPAPRTDIPEEYRNRPGLVNQAAPEPEANNEPPANDMTNGAATDAGAPVTPAVDQPEANPAPAATPQVAPVPPAQPPLTPAPRPRTHSVTLKVKSAISGGSTRSDGYTRSVSREQSITISAHNLGHDADAVSVKWYFVARPASGNSNRRYIYDQGSKELSLGPNAWKEIGATAPELEQTVYEGYASRSREGQKADGWIVTLVDDTNKVLALEASTSTLEGIAKTPATFSKLLDSKPPDDD